VAVIRNEHRVGARLVEAVEIDLHAGTIVVERDGKVVDGPRPLSLEERRLYGPAPLDAAGVMATLNAVLGLWSVEDAANAVGLTPEDLVAEAEAWAVASEAQDGD